MSRRIMVIGYVSISDDEYDPGPNGPLTEDTFHDIRNYRVGSLDDVTFQDEGEET
jgi:hypothetical protein